MRGCVVCGSWGLRGSLLRAGSRWFKTQRRTTRSIPRSLKGWSAGKFRVSVERNGKTANLRPEAGVLRQTGCVANQSRPASSDDLGVSGFYSIHKDVVVVHNQPTRVDRRRGHNRIVRFLRIILECLGFALEWIFVREGDDERMTVGFPGQRITLT